MVLEKLLAINYIIAWFRKRIFLCLLIVSSILGISINNIIISWRIIEINLLAFIPLLRFRKKLRPHIIRIKYFLAQSLGSIIFFISLIFLTILNKIIFYIFFITLRILWKIGFPPFHLWLFRLIIDLNWWLFFIIRSWQKILPLFLLNHFYFHGWEYFLILSLLISIIGTLFQSNLKKLLIYSSIFIRTWILSSIINIKIIWFILLSLYRFILFFLTIFFSRNKIVFIERRDFYSISYLNKIYIFFIILSIAGIPPLLGFFIKIRVLLILLEAKKLILSFVLVLSSIIIIFMYVRIFLRGLLTFNLINKNNYNRKNYITIIYIVILILSPLIFL